MIKPKRVDHFYGERTTGLFEEIKSRMQNPPVLSMPNRKGRLYCIQTPVSSPLAVHYTNSKMENPGLLPTRAKECLKQQGTIPSQNWKSVDWPLT